MVEVPPNKKFLYYEDNEDGTCTITISIPELDLFTSAVVELSLDDMFAMVVPQLSEDFHQLVMDKTTFVPDSSEDL